MKDGFQDLAMFGGKPAFAEPIHVGRPNIGNRDKLLQRFTDLLDRRWLTNNGCYVREFEKRIADRLGVKHCIAMCNATIALEIASRALGLKGEVIMPSFTFIATAHALQWQEISPVFCDIDPRTHTMDPHLVEKLITPRTTGLVGVHLWGRPCDTEALTDIARRRGLKLLLDAAQAFACSHQGRMIGNFGDAEVLSFHATKFFNTFEGGAVVTNDDSLAHKVRLMKNFGFKDYDEVIYIGTNGKMSEVSAAMGLTGLESLDEFIAVNRSHYKLYQSQLAHIPGVTLLTYDEKEQCNYQYIVLEIDEAGTHLTRDELMTVLRAENILARRYFYPGCHRMEPYQTTFPNVGMRLPETESVSSRVIELPTGTGVTDADVRRICQIVQLAVENGALMEKVRS